MLRRNFVKGLFVLGVCLAPAGVAHAEGVHWSYEGEDGPGRWGELSPDNLACSVGTQQSPLDITQTVDAALPELAVNWTAGEGKVVNNGHTIQVNIAPGSKLVIGAEEYELLQFHFHAPSEHTIDGTPFPMEVHFVHRNAAGALGVLGVFIMPGAANATFAGLATAFPAEKGGEVAASIDPRGLLPENLSYFAYEGSLTTPPCSEIVHWMVAKQPLEVAAADIERFTTIYPMNARPTLEPNRRFILSSR